MAADAPGMLFPPYDPAEFRRRLRQWSGQDLDQAAALLQVSRSTLNRWLAGRQRVPWATWCLVYLMGSGDLGALDPHWHGWTIEGRHLVNGRARYLPNQVASFEWVERQNRNLVDQLGAMQRRRVPLGTEQAQLLNAARGALEALIAQAHTSQALLGECLSQEEYACSATGIYGSKG